jgi:hypothetical protein
MTNPRNGRKFQCPIWNSGGMRWNDWQLNDTDFSLQPSAFSLRFAALAIPAFLPNSHLPFARLRRTRHQ